MSLFVITVNNNSYTFYLVLNDNKTFSSVYLTLLIFLIYRIHRGELPTPLSI